MWAFTLSLYTWNSRVESVVEMFGAVVARCLLKQFYWIILLDGWSWNEMERQAGVFGGQGRASERWDMQPQSYQLMVGTIQFPITNLGRKKLHNEGFFNNNKIKLCIVKPFNLKTFMLHVMPAKVDAINYFNNSIGAQREICLIYKFKTSSKLHQRIMGWLVKRILLINTIVVSLFNLLQGDVNCYGYKLLLDAWM